MRVSKNTYFTIERIYIMKETLMKQWDNILNLLEIEYDVSHMMINTWIRALSIKEVTDENKVIELSEKFLEEPLMETKNGLFADVPAEQWNDWAWQAKNRITGLADRKKYIKLTPEEELQFGFRV